jgi:two-component system OmpR family sensor kinase
VSLRARLLAVVALLAVVGLAAADVATYVSLRSFLVDRVDSTVNGSAVALVRSLQFGRRGDPTDILSLSAANPGLRIGVASADGTVEWSPFGAGVGGTVSPATQLPLSFAEATEGDGTTFTLHGTSGSHRYRVRSVSVGGSDALLVAAPLDDVDSTLRRLVTIEAVVSAAVIGLVLLSGLWLVRVGLAPLRRIEHTADAIAAGDLTRRVEGAGQRTEVGRLGAALNVMLGRIEAAFAEQRASEERLRRFVGDASHELRTPLAAVQAYAELFRRGARDRPDDLERSMRGIEQEARRMGGLVDDLLLLARLDQGRPLEHAPVELDDVARDAVEAARAVGPAWPVALDAEHPVVVEGDRARLRQVLDNLLANVRSHAPPGTATRVAVARDNGSVRVTVADDGPGMEREQAARAFERFYRADPSRSRDAGGSGLGLSIVAAIAEAHGGHVDLETAPGAGARITVFLPAGPPQPALRAGPADPQPIHSAGADPPEGEPLEPAPPRGDEPHGPAVAPT